MNNLHFTKKNPSWLAGSLIVVAALILAACSSVSAATNTSTKTPEVMPTATLAPTLAPTTAPAVAGPDSPAMINVATDAKLGKFLVDGKGMTLYMFKKDALDKSNCSGGCLKAWPPLLSKGTPAFGAGVDDSRLGTITLADGTLQVTYNHMPLYYYVQDKAVGDITGQDVGNVWFVVSPDGTVVTGAVAQGGAYGAAPAPTATTAPVMAATSMTVTVVTNASLDKFLVDDKGMSLYLFTKDTPGKSNCSGGCLVNWPPLLTKGAPAAGMGVTASKLGTITLADGSLQVTYNNLPLYYYAGDKTAGDVNGQGIGNNWFVVAP
jgi:predicted lipoprotein with Yx(FWY)xxD motif